MAAAALALLLACVSALAAFGVQPAYAGTDSAVSEVPSAASLAPGWDETLAASRLTLLSLFHGTSRGSELSRAPNRAEAAAMLVRLLGKEAEAADASYAHPFLDVPAWADAYVGWLWRQGLSRGLSATRFGSTLPVDAKMYGAFLLRALGYADEEGDDAWSRSLERLVALGALTGAESEALSDDAGNPFTRGDLAVLSYRLLLCPRETDGRLMIDVFADTGLVPAMSIGGTRLAAGMPQTLAVLRFGTPTRMDASLDDDATAVYAADPTKFFLAGIRSGMVVSFFSNAASFRLADSFGPDSLISDMKKIWSADTADSGAESDYACVLKSWNARLTCYQDPVSPTRLSGVLVTLKNACASGSDPTALTAAEKSALAGALARQTLELANAERVRAGLAPFAWDALAAGTAVAHSADMAAKGYFDHYSPDGTSPFERMEDNGISYSRASENIAAGYLDAVRTHEAWMHSEGHRKNLLGATERLGAGVAFGGHYRCYFTQDFYTPAQ